ncbi:MAG: EpsG family protein, partial [Angelakisella sp.]
SSLLYMTLQFLPHSMNLLRQSIAASIIFAGWGFLKKGKFIPYALVVLLAGCFHISAIIMLPAYFLMRMPFKLPIIATYGVGTVVAYVAFDPLLKLVTTYIFPQYALYVDASIYSSGNGFSYSIVPGMCLIAALIAAKPLIAKDKNNSVMIYSVLLAFVFYLFMSKMYIVERLSIYFFMVAMLLLPEIVSLLTPEPLPAKPSPAAKIAYKDKKQNQQIFTGAIILITIFYMLFCVKTGAHKAYPYVSIFNQQDAVSNDDYFQNH